MKKFFAICLTLAMLLGMLPMTVSAAEEATPIGSVDEITDLTASYVLTQDITVTAPIGSFSGIFDGGGYTVTVNITASTSNAGMFSTIASGAEVKNFKIANSTVTNASYEYTGLVAGTNNGTVSDIVVENSTVNGYTTVGGIVGKNTGTVTNCAFESGTVKKGSSNDTGFGGIVGENTGTVSYCSNSATIDHSGGRSNYDYTGGIVGRNQYNGKVTDCFNSGALTDGANKSYYLGGVSGQNSGSVANSHNTGTITSTSSRIYGVAPSCTNSYYLEGCGASTGGTAKTAEEFAALASTLGENWVDGSDGYPVLAWQDWKYSNTAIKYLVEYYTETLEEGVYELNSSVEVKAEPDTAVTAGTPAIEGFTFDESNENNVLTGTASAELVLKCYYTRNSYTLTWDVGEGSITGEEGTYTAGSVKYGAAITYPEVSNPGYIVSWSETLATMPASDTTVTATWRVASYPVTWDANGGVFETEDSWGDVTTSETLTWSSVSGTSGGAIYGQTLGKYRWSETSTSYSNRSLPAPVHESMVFGGWYTAAEGGDLVDKDTVVTIPETGSFTYYAHWNEAWTVTFDANGGYMSSDDKTVLVGKGEAYGNYGTIPTATKSGHELAGWFDAEGNALTADTLIHGDVTYTAQWTPKTYTITFHANGGTGTMEPQTFTYGVPQNISKNLFTREGYQFVGWATWSTATSASYTDEQEYTIGGYNQNFYAIWEEVRYNLTLNVTPEGAEVVVKNANGVTQYPSNGIYNLQEGSYTYTITLYGYETVEETVALTADTVLDIALVKIPTYNVSFNVTKPAEGGDTVITITNADGMEMTASEDGSYDLIPGTYNYVVSAAGCSKAKAEFTITDSDLSFDIELVISFAWDGTTKTEPATISAEEAVGEYEGMEGWYLITSGEELAWFANQVNTTSSGYTGNAVLAKDIDLGGEVWTPMGYSWNYYFNGTFDGNGHAILGLYCNGADYQALFGYSKGTVKNLTVKGEINANGNYVGGISAYQNGGSILNCAAFIDSTSTYGTGRNAGIAGYAYNVTIDRCFNAGTITGSKFVGGIAGYVGGTTTISNCYNVGTLVEGEVSESSGSYGCSGGILGYAGDYGTVTVENCYNVGDLSNGNTRIGGIGGELGEAVTITNCYYLDTVSKGVGYGTPASDASAAKTAEELKSADMLTTLGEAFKADGTDAQSINSGYPILSWQTLPEIVEEPETMKIYFQNNWMWTDVCLYYWYEDGTYGTAWPGAPMEYHGNDGTYDVYVLEIPADIYALIINGVKDDGSGNRDQTPNITEGWYDGICYYMKWDNGNQVGSEPIDVILCKHVNTTTLTVDATCTEDGSITVTCDDCGETVSTATIPATGHQNTTTTTVDATCTEAGSITVTCDDCGETISTEYTPTTDHSYSYTNNGDDHTISCANCDYNVTEGHTYVDGTCICGAVEEVVPGEPTQVEVKISHSVSFDSDLKMNYRIKYENIAAVVPNYVTEGAYLVVEKDIYPVSGDAYVETCTLQPDLSTDAERMLFTLAGIQSAEMGSELRAVLYFFDAEGKEYYTQVDAYSILAYAQLSFDSYSNTELYTMLIDMLNYGAAAQVYFGRNTDNLVNAGMDAYQQYASTQLASELTDSKTVLENDRAITAVTAMGFSVNFADRTEMNVKLTVADGYSKEDITCVKVLDESGNEVAAISEFTWLDDGRIQVTFYGIKSVQMRDMFYFEAYVGEQLASETIGYSVEAYAKSNISSSNADLADMVTKCIYYGDAAYAYFN